MAKTPAKISDLKHQEYVIDIAGTFKEIHTAAVKWFQENFFEIKAKEVKVKLLFTEGTIDVYECYTDPGSVDYLYITAFTM